MNSNESKTGFVVRAGKDRHGDAASIWGLLPLTSKLSTQDTQGGMYIFEHRNQGKGGPPRHIHHEQDEWFYVIAGEYAMEVGDAKYRLTPGDSLFAPRKVAHAWACVSDTPGTMITIVSPPGTFETFLRDTTKCGTVPAPEDVAKVFAAHGMTVVGPPLSVGDG